MFQLKDNVNSVPYILLFYWLVITLFLPSDLLVLLLLDSNLSREVEVSSIVGSQQFFGSFIHAFVRPRRVYLITTGNKQGKGYL